jgi:hypothetical protein
MELGTGCEIRIDFQAMLNPACILPMPAEEGETPPGERAEVVIRRLWPEQAWAC